MYLAVLSSITTLASYSITTKKRSSTVLLMHSGSVLDHIAATMAQSLPKVSQPWHFVYPLAYVLVDGKQVANGEVDLVLKRELDLASSHSAYQHTLAVYTKDINPRVCPFLRMLSRL